MKTHLRNPHQRALVTLAGLVSLSLLVTLATWGLSIAGLVELTLIWIGMTFFILLALMLIAVWILGALQVRRARAFLESERPLVRWTYTEGELQQFKETLWEEEKDDWKIQWGCLALLLGIAGLLTGLMIGLDEGGVAIVINGLIGLLLGGLAGAVIGVWVAGGNFLGAQQAYRQKGPWVVALGVEEIYASDDYFRGNGHNSYIQSATIHHGRPTTLEFQLIFPPRPRMPLEEQWIIPVPVAMIEKVEEILPLLSPVESSIEE